MTRTHLLLVAFAVLVATGAHAESMYKWVDEKGVTHFSSDPPPDGKGKKIDVKPVPPSSPQAVQRPEDWRTRAAEMRADRLEKEQKEEAAKLEAQRMAERNKSRCLSAQSALDQLKSGKRLYTVNSRGERVFMEDADYAAQTEKAQSEIKAYCPR